jgi:hypothetical protein
MGNFPGTAKDQVKHVNHAMKRAAKMVHHAKFKFNINKTMRQEIDFFCKKLLLDLDIKWKTPIAHIILRMPTFTSFGDSCLEGAGGYSIPLGYWWHIPFPRRLCSAPSSTKRTIAMVASSQLTSLSSSPSS